MTALKDTTVGTAASQASVRPNFNRHSLDMLIERINSMPEILETDWRELVLSEFTVLPAQAKSVVDVAVERVNEIQTYFGHMADYIRRGGKITARIVRRPLEEQTPEAVHEVHIELVELPLPAPPIQRAGIPKALRIAHCDADCRNWGWG